MTLVQLEYIVAVDTYRSFVGAADKCFVTQPTLSMQVQKLEEMLNVKIFDRSKQPVIPTEIGSQIIEQARLILQESQRNHQQPAAGYRRRAQGRYYSYCCPISFTPGNCFDDGKVPGS
jgi:DNA-binding transcriptional LysR family regulator